MLDLKSACLLQWSPDEDRGLSLKQEVDDVQRSLLRSRRLQAEDVRPHCWMLHHFDQAYRALGNGLRRDFEPLCFGLSLVSMQDPLDLGMSGFV